MLELVTAVRDFIEQRAMPELKGHTAFHARVAANALGVVARELETGGRAAAEETARLEQILGCDGTLETLNRELCRRIRGGEIDLDAPALRAHLERSTRDKLAIDQPQYAALKRALARDREAGKGSV